MPAKPILSLKNHYLKIHQTESFLLKIAQRQKRD
jgi:hypothetical protein